MTEFTEHIIDNNNWQENDRVIIVSRGYISLTIKNSTYDYIHIKGERVTLQIINSDIGSVCVSSKLASFKECVAGSLDVDADVVYLTRCDIPDVTMSCKLCKLHSLENTKISTICGAEKISVKSSQNISFSGGIIEEIFIDDSKNVEFVSEVLTVSDDENLDTDKYLSCDEKLCENDSVSKDDSFRHPMIDCDTVLCEGISWEICSAIKTPKFIEAMV